MTTHRVVFSWDIDPQWQIETDLNRTSEVEVRFFSETPNRTRVELEHTAISIGTAKVGRLYARASAPKVAGRFISSASSRLLSKEANGTHSLHALDASTPVDACGSRTSRLDARMFDTEGDWVGS